MQQNEAGPFVDIIEAGNINAVATRDGKIYCDWMQGACDELHAYVICLNDGAKPRSDCLQPLQQAVELERQIRALPLPPSMTPLAYAQKVSALAQQRDRILAKVPLDCFGLQAEIPKMDPRSYPLTDTFDSGTTTSGTPGKLLQGHAQENQPIEGRKTGTTLVNGTPVTATILNSHPDYYSIAGASIPSGAYSRIWGEVYRNYQNSGTDYFKITWLQYRKGGFVKLPTGGILVPIYPTSDE